MMEGSGESGDIWIFRCEEGRWIWVHRDVDGEEMARSRQRFSTIEECKSDAERFGYRAGPERIR